MKNKKFIYSAGILIFILVVALFFNSGGSFLGDKSSAHSGSFKQYGSLSDNFTYIEPDFLDEEVVLSALINSEKEIEDMKSSGLSINLVNDKLLIAKRYFIGHNMTLFNDFVERAKGQRDKEYLEGLLDVARNTPPYEIERMNLSETIRLTQEISFIRGQAYDILDYVVILEEEKALLKDVDVSSVDDAIEMVRLAVEEERYSEAVSEIELAEIELGSIRAEVRRVGGLANLSKSFLEKHWWKILLVILILSLLYRPLAKMWRIESSKNQINKMNLELETLNKLMKKAQSDCFKDKKISESTYKIKEKRYRRRINEIKHKLPVLKAIVNGEEIKDKVEKRKILEFKR